MPTNPVLRDENIVQISSSAKTNATEANAPESHDTVHHSGRGGISS